MKTTSRPFFYSLFLLAAALLLSVAVGSVFIPPAALWDLARAALTGRDSVLPQADTYRIILGSLRLPRTLLVAFTGAALATSGGAYQGLFRNPLADPYMIGVASGAGLGAVLAMTAQWARGGAGMLAVPLAAFAGALLAVGIVYQLARVGRTLPTTTLILAGVAVSSFCTALSSYLMLNSTGELRRALVWQLGGTTLSGWGPVVAALPYLAVGCLVLLANGHALNVLQFGDEQAKQLGLPVERVRGIIVLAATLTTAAAVAFSGVIGFVGLVVPHLVRMVWGGDYRRLLPLSIVCGAAFLLIADVLARTLMAPQELPVGVITSLAGAPFFLWVLRRNKQQSYW
ncbi:ABC-type Fe3+-siderophore transport system, permease component [Longilinea arvoryzae]|uniref:ABC-type Fe3+-siderophore transport system, permease component n=1 Tax=Longilinea arvoryzae TaxID=360412 RepID=A0A0S7BNF4_9CHLR|nr:iron ABC transporter permease [Longilinea arvoryzae]GAP15864.1 ABC-type Fe3+-siderophore transport system, permease component [Longilinea arvoryzae]